MDTSWVHTFDDYYINLTALIFRNVVSKLSSTPAARFIFSEVFTLAFVADTVGFIFHKSFKNAHTVRYSTLEASVNTALDVSVNTDSIR